MFSHQQVEVVNRYRILAEDRRFQRFSNLEASLVSRFLSAHIKDLYDIEQFHRESFYGSKNSAIIHDTVEIYMHDLCSRIELHLKDNVQGYIFPPQHIINQKNARIKAADVMNEIFPSRRCNIM